MQRLIRREEVIHDDFITVLYIFTTGQKYDKAALYRVAAIFPEHFQSFTVTSKNYFFEKFFCPR
jgi:hypothetical protein